MSLQLLWPGILIPVALGWVTKEAESSVACRREEVHAYVQECQEVYDYEDSRGGGISIGLGPNNCPAVLLWHPTGYTAVVSSPCYSSFLIVLWHPTGYTTVVSWTY